MPLIAGASLIQKAYIGASAVNAIMHAGVNVLGVNGGGPVLPPAGRTMLANLKSSLILDEGTGGPTWSRATKAWRFNERGYLEEIASGCAVFGGARLVRNRIGGNSDNYSSGVPNSVTIVNASEPNHRGTNTAVRYAVTPGLDYHFVRSSILADDYPGGATLRSTVVVSRNLYRYIGIRAGQTSGSEVIDLQTNTWVTNRVETLHRSFEIIDANWIRLTTSAYFAATATKVFDITPASPTGLEYWTAPAGLEFVIADAQLNNISNYDASYVPEYVSVGSDTDKNFLLHTDDFSQAAWTKTNITITQSAIANPVNGLINAQKVEATADAATNMYQSVTNCGSTAGNIASFYVKQGSGATEANRFLVRNVTTATNLLSINVNYSTGVITYVTGSSGASVTDVGNGWWLVKLVVTSGISNNDTLSGYIAFVSSPETAGEFCYVYRPYLGRGVTAPAVLPAVAGVWDPFGAGIDGAKYFETDWQGAPIAAANLLRFRREAAATNNLRYSRDLRYSAWTSLAKTGAAEVLTNGDFSSGSSGWTVSGADATHIATFSGGTLRYQSDTTTPQLSVSQGSVLVPGETYTVTLTLSSYTSGLLKSSSFLGDPTISSDTSLTKTITGVASSANFSVSRNTTNVDVTIDSISVKLASVKCTQASGLDGIANTATTLTAAAAGAIILQPITLASAARCASAYVKRRTGTGTISFTQDGGSTWTDITAQINGSTWSRVQITSTMANPSVGFKISTSGDAIDVDCVQNEAGAVATSPIVTTTAAVTRNADSLTYQTASNIDFAVGTIYAELQCSGSAVSRFAVEVGSATFQLSTADANTDFRAYDTTLTAIKTGLSDITTGVRKRAASWGPAGLSVTGDGLVPQTVGFDGSYGSGATVSIGRNINGYIGPIAIYNYQMTDAELQAITA